MSAQVCTSSTRWRQVSHSLLRFSSEPLKGAQVCRSRRRHDISETLHGCCITTRGPQFQPSRRHILRFFPFSLPLTSLFSFPQLPLSNQASSPCCSPSVVVSSQQTRDETQKSPTRRFVNGTGQFRPTLIRK